MMDDECGFQEASLSLAETMMGSWAVIGTLGRDGDSVVEAPRCEWVAPFSPVTHPPYSGLIRCFSACDTLR